MEVGSGKGRRAVCGEIGGMILLCRGVLVISFVGE